MYNFFTSNEEELDKVIRETLADQDAFVSAQTIQTGWTNITMDVKGELQDYIFRFPRNLFFARMMVKDCQVCQLLHNRIHTTTPDMKLKMSENRPFSVHKKIKGDSLTSRMDSLSPAEQANLIDDLSGFLAELHSLPISLIPNNIKESLGNFLDGLASVHKGNYDLGKHRALYEMENHLQSPSIIHGDFNPGNVLLDETGHVSGIIDFSFTSISDGHADLGRFWGRSNAQLGGALVEAYQAKTKQHCDMQKIQDVVDIFKYVEYKYVEYMQSNHPEIKIPESVLKVSAMEAKRLQTPPQSYQKDYQNSLQLQ